MLCSWSLILFLMHLNSNGLDLLILYSGVWRIQHSSGSFMPVVLHGGRIPSWSYQPRGHLYGILRWLSSMSLVMVFTYCSWKPKTRFSLNCSHEHLWDHTNRAGATRKQLDIYARYGIRWSFWEGALYVRRVSSIFSRWESLCFYDNDLFLFGSSKSLPILMLAHSHSLDNKLDNFLMFPISGVLYCIESSKCPKLAWSTYVARLSSTNNFCEAERVVYSWFDIQCPDTVSMKLCKLIVDFLSQKCPRQALFAPKIYQDSLHPSHLWRTYNHDFGASRGLRVIKSNRPRWWELIKERVAF